MIIGVYLSSTHQGYSCKTWPLCPNGFNLPPEEFFLEHYHRFFVFILLIALVTFTIVSFVKTNLKKLRTNLSVALSLLIFQIILGWMMIETKLNPLVVATHLAVGLSLFAMILVTLISTYNEFKIQKSKTK